MSDRHDELANTLLRSVHEERGRWTQDRDMIAQALRTLVESEYRRGVEDGSKQLRGYLGEKMRRIDSAHDRMCREEGGKKALGGPGGGA